MTSRFHFMILVFLWYSSSWLVPLFPRIPIFLFTLSMDFCWDVRRKRTLYVGGEILTDLEVCRWCVLLLHAQTLKRGCMTWSSVGSSFLHFLHTYRLLRRSLTSPSSSWSPSTTTTIHVATHADILQKRR